jgi:hypothetical protein
MMRFALPPQSGMQMGNARKKDIKRSEWSNIEMKNTLSYSCRNEDGMFDMSQTQNQGEWCKASPHR